MTKHFKSYQWPSEFNNVVRQLSQAVRFVWQSGPTWTIANVVIFILQGILPLLALYIMKLVIDEITVIIKTPNIGRDFTHIGLLIGLEGLIALFIALSSVIARWIGDLHAEIVTDHMHNIIHSKSVQVDLEYYENSKYHDTLHRSLKESSYRPLKNSSGFAISWKKWSFCDSHGFFIVLSSLGYWINSFYRLCSWHFYSN